MNNRILLVAAHSVIEPLGLLHLAGLARDLGWERKFHLTENHDFEPLLDKIRRFSPDVVGFNIYTGNHIQTFAVIDEIRKDYPNIRIVLGGPHATYFPSDSLDHADFVVMSEGFRALRRILTDDVEEGIIPLSVTEPFPFPDRELLYTEYPSYGTSQIKSIIGMTGCPYRCTYCYNSSRPEDIKTTPEIAAKIASALGMSGRLFPYNVRPVEDVVKEAEYIVNNYPTSLIYFQDDVHGFDIKEWLPELAEKWPKRVGVPYHAQMRWEMTSGDGGTERLRLIKKAGGHGLTLAIEAADYHIRKEVLDRGTKQEEMYEGMKKVIGLGFKVRTEQISGLPYGATSEPSPINLEADLALIELNVDLKAKTGGPTMAWASTFAPYAGTKLGMYSVDFGHYSSFDNHDVPDTFFEKSVLRFPKKWVGLNLGNEGEDAWLDEEELATYLAQNAALRKYFNLFCHLENGHVLAREFLTRQSDYSPEVLCDYIVMHQNSSHSGLDVYFHCFPKPLLLKERYNRYMADTDEDMETVLSNATRHHLYDEVLYCAD